MTDIASSISASISGATNGAFGNAGVPAQRAAQSVNQADFLKLMTAQIAAQDPFDPMDQTAMLGQLAQFSQVAGTAEMNVSLAALVNQVRDQGQLLADIRDRLTPAPAPATTPTAIPTGV